MKSIKKNFKKATAGIEKEKMTRIAEVAISITDYIVNFRQYSNREEIKKY